MRDFSRLSIGNAAIAVALSLMLATGSFTGESFAALRAYASEPAEDSVADASAANEAGEKEPTGGVPQENGQITEDVALEPTAPDEGDATMVPDSTAPAPTPTPSGDRVSADVALGDDAHAQAGTVVSEGLVYRVEAGGASVALIGWRDETPRGDLALPDSVSSGSDMYKVRKIGGEGAVLKDSAVESLTIPASVEEVADGALPECPTLSAVEVSAKNEQLASFEGMLFDKDMKRLLFVPEGKTGAAVLPKVVEEVPEGIFGKSPLVRSINLGGGGVHYDSAEGALYTLGFAELVACPAGIGSSVAIDPACNRIGAQAFAGCGELATIVVPGFVQAIEADAFPEAVARDAVVALPGGEGYDARRAVWEAAGFSRFAEPAAPGDAAEPEQGGSGFAFELLSDYTLAVSWTGGEGPAADLEVPASAEVGGAAYRVSRVADGAFEGRASLESVSLPGSVRSIGDRAFAGCASLSSAPLPDGLRAVGDSAFEGAALADVWLPASVESVGSRAFADCVRLARIVALGDIPEVAPDALAGCAGATVYAPYREGGAYPWNPGLPAAGNHLAPYGLAFAPEPLRLETGGSADLFEGGLREVPGGCRLEFSYAAKPLSVDAQGTAAAKSPGTSEVSAAIALDGRTLARASRTVEVAPAQDLAASEPAPAPETSADPVAEASGGTYPQVSRTMALAEEPIAETVFTVGDFEYTVIEDGETEETRTVKVAAVDPKTISGDIAIPATVEDPQTKKTYRVTTIANAAFWEAKNLRTVSFAPEGYLEIIEATAFSNAGITHLDIPVGVKEIHWSVIRWCENLESITLPEGLKSIGAHAIQDCPKLTGTLYIPASVETMSCPVSGTNHIAFEVDPANPWFNSVDGVIYSEDGTRLVQFPGGKSADAATAIPEGVTSIDGFAFFHCANLYGDLVIPEGVTDLGERTFTSCTGITSVRFPSTLRWTGEVVFSSCTSLSGHLVFPEGLTNIGNNMFINCPGITSIDLPSTLTSIGINAFWEANMTTLYVHGSMPNLTFGEQVWSGTRQRDMTVYLPSVSTDGNNEPFDTMKQAWVDKGFTAANILPGGGPLPLANDQAGSPNTDETKASWKVAPGGTLVIQSTEKVADFGWVYNNDGWKNEHWGPVRSLVKSIDTTNLAAVDSMNCWFRVMPELEDISRVAIPQGTKTLANLFTLDKKITEIPASFTLHENVGLESVESLFNNTGIKTIPASFRLPDGIQNCSSIFANSASLEAIEPGFAFPDDATDVGYAFRICTSLRELPAGFTLPRQATKIAYAFDGCTNLVSLPESFVLSSSVTNPDYMNGVFLNCDSLTTLPATFVLPEIATKSKTSLFSCSTMTPLYYAGDDPNMLDASLASWWTAQNRTLVVPTAGSVAYKVASAGDAAFETWVAVPPDEAGLVPDLEPSGRVGQVFTLWYADEACTQRIDFSKPIADQAKQEDDGYSIYGRYASGTLGGALPCVAGTGSAFWSLSDDGSLYIRGGGTTGNMAWWSTERCYFNYWGPYRDKIVRVAATPALRVQENVICWFYDCPNLCDVTDFAIPIGTSCTGRLFCECPSLKTLPEGFTLPESVTEPWSMFSFSGLVSLPDSFVLHDKVQNPAGIFDNCKDLISLPANFSFTCPTANLYNAFRDCTSLTRLPDNFTFPLDRAYDSNDHEAPFLYCDIAPGEPRVTTYYAGNDPAVLNFDWASQNRTLVTDAVDRNLFTVDYRVVGDDGSWTTRATVLTDSEGFAPDPGTPQSPQGYAFTGWCEDPDCLVPFDFGKPVDQATTLYGKWIVHGGKGKAGGEEGWLPVDADSPAGSSAWWYITNDGTLYVGCDGGASVGNLGWPECNSQAEFDQYWSVGYWSPYRQDIRRLIMEDDVRAKSMQAWFAYMRNIETADFFIPVNTVNASSLFDYCNKLTNLPDDLAMPASGNLQNMTRMFRGCYVLEELPRALTIPDSVTSLEAMFENTSITALPDNFRLPEHPQGDLVTSWMFSVCKNLRTLPAGFVLPEGTVGCRNMFRGCTSLTALPKGFSIPTTVTTAQHMFWECTSLAALPEGFGFDLDGNGGRAEINFENMFYSCPSLTYLPDSFRLDLFGDAASGAPVVAKGLNGLFDTPTYTPENPLDTYYAGNVEALVPKGYTKDGYWKELQHRNLQSIADLPADRHQVKLLLPGGQTGAYDAGDPYLVLVTGSDGLLAEPAAPNGNGIGQAFVGWYVDEACTIPFDFTKSVAGQGESAPNPVVVLYAKYQQTSGPLPTVDHPDNGGPTGNPAIAGWSLASDGTLFIACAEGQTIAQIDKGDFEAGRYWRPLKDQVTKVVFDSGLKTLSVAFWFEGMANLTDVSRVFVPDGTQTACAMFKMCSSLAVIPDGFSLPGTVKNTSAMFELTAIRTLPAGFTIPEGAETASWMFSQCASLEILPAEFTLPSTVANSQRMFNGCVSLASLPLGFRLRSASDPSYMFNGCTALKSLPEGFTLPEGTARAEAMFRDCSSLTSLPSSFRLPEGMEGATGMFRGCSSLVALPEGFNFPSTLRWVGEIFYGCSNLRSLPSTLSLNNLTPQAANLLERAFLVEGDPVPTYYSGNLENILPSDGYWETQNRTLVLSSSVRPTGTHAVWFVTKDAGEADYAPYLSVLTDASGKVPDPGSPSRFGYAFGGWRTEAGEPFDFSAAIERDMTLYGTYAPIVQFTAPTSVRLALDSGGQAAPARIELRSESAVPLKVSSVSCAAGRAADELLPSAADRERAAVTVRPDGMYYPYYLTPGSVQPTALPLGAASPGKPAALGCEVGLAVPDGARLAFFGDGFTTDFAKLAFTVEPAA